MFSYLNKELEKTELEDYHLLSKFYFYTISISCLKFFWIKFWKVSIKDLLPLKMLDALKYRFERYGWKF